MYTCIKSKCHLEQRDMLWLENMRRLIRIDWEREDEKKSEVKFYQLLAASICFYAQVLPFNVLQLKCCKKANFWNIASKEVNSKEAAKPNWLDLCHKTMIVPQPQNSCVKVLEGKRSS